MVEREQRDLAELVDDDVEMEAEVESAIDVDVAARLNCFVTISRAGDTLQPVVFTELIRIDSDLWNLLQKRRDGKLDAGRRLGLRLATGAIGSRRCGRCSLVGGGCVGGGDGTGALDFPFVAAAPL